MDLSRFLEALRQGSVDPVHSAKYHGGKSSPPPAPDYGAAAQATQKSQMTSQYTPYGTQTYLADSTSPSGFRSTIDLDPTAQKTLDTQIGLSNDLGQAARDYMPNVQQMFGKPMDLQSVDDVSNKAYGAMTARLDPQWQQAQTSEETKLANQGLRPGMEAYDNDMRVFNQGKNDAYQQANLGAISTMPQTYQLAASEYQQPLNILNALRTGAQIQNPQFSAQPGANYSGAAQSQGQYDMNTYNQQVGQQNAMMGGLASLGSAGIGAYGLMNAAPAAMMFSDRRLKSNIERVGTHKLGIGIYEYDIFGRRERGVMADEVEKVKPEAVVEMPNGYKAVNYGMLNA